MNTSTKMKIVKEPKQLDLFTSVSNQDEDYSNLVEMYDILPKYYHGNIERVDNKYLDSIHRKFKYRKIDCELTITPALIKNANNEEKAYYPSKREEIVEDALRKIAIDRGCVYIDGDAGVQFSLYELEQELIKRGHSYNKSQIKEAIKICHHTSIQIKKSDEEDMMSFHLFEAIGFSSSNKEGLSKAYVKFNPLVTKSIKENSFRVYNYRQCMDLSMNLSRWLYKKVTHLHRQAATDNPYKIKLSSIIRDSGISNYPRLTDNDIQVKKCLNELKSKNIIFEYHIEKHYSKNRRNKVEDILYEIWFTDEFCANIKIQSSIRA